MFRFFKRGEKRRREESPSSDTREAKRQASSVEDKSVYPLVCRAPELTTAAVILPVMDTVLESWHNLPQINHPSLSRCSSISYSVSGLTLSSIVFVHGLTGGREKTWTYKQGDTEILWPRDLLPSDIPQARIMAFGYDVDVVRFWERTSQSRIANHANNLVSSLANCRMKVDSVSLLIVLDGLY